MNSKPGCAATLCRLFFGFMTGLVGLQLYLESGYEGIFPVAMFFAFLLAVGGRWFLLGLFGLAKPLPPRKLTWGLAGITMLVLGCLGPTVSSSYQKSQEPVRWKAVEGSKDPVRWQTEYHNKVAEPFRRADYLSRECEAICDKAAKESNFTVLRNQAQLAFVTNSKDYDDGARKAISEAWAYLQAEGLKKIKPTKLANPALSAAFKQVLEALAANPTRKVQLHYDAEGSLASLPQDAEINPKYKKLEIIPVGEAFQEEAHKRRAGQVRAALQSSFDTVWQKGMMDIQLAPGDAEVAGDVNFWIHAKVHRIPSFYINTDANEKPNALIYKCEVEWRFRITRDDKEIGQFGLRSEPAKEVDYRIRKTDPKWAVYSIVMDSAADNFARLIVGRLGLIPPPLPKVYNFVP